MQNEETVLAAKASFNGKLEGANVTLQGQFTGDLKASGIVKILEGSEVNAKVEANLVEIGGKFQGDVKAESLRLLRPARASGTFRAIQARRRRGWAARRRLRDRRQSTRACEDQGPRVDEHQITAGDADEEAGKGGGRRETQRG